MNALRQTGRWQISLASLLAALSFGATTVADQAETLHRATDQALQRLAEQLKEAKRDGVETVAVIPLGGDTDGYATDGLKRALAEAGYKLFSRDEPEYNRLLEEIEFGVRRGDVMDQETIKKFGDIEGVDAIVMGNIAERINLWSIRGAVTLSLQIGGTETLQIWPCGPVQGEAFIHWSDALMQFWRYPLLLLGALVIVLILILFFAKLKKAYRPL
jgi:hypothetical protein